MILTRNKNLYFKCQIEDNFSSRLILFLLHFSFFLSTYKQNNNKKLMQDIYDFIFRQIDLSLRESGDGDVSVNKKMKTYINMLYSIIDKIDKWEIYEYKDKTRIFNFYIEIKDNNEKFADYFDKYYFYLSKISLNSFTKSVINHKF